MNKPKPFIHTLRANQTTAVAIGRVVLPVYFFAFLALGWVVLWVAIGATVDIAFDGNGQGAGLFGLVGLLPVVIIGVIVGVTALVRHLIEFNREAQRDL
ncbi:membrane protein [Microbacterium phage Cece]|nr:membrane protein [Microbacterium phage Cece]